MPIITLPIDLTPAEPQTPVCVVHMGYAPGRRLSIVGAVTGLRSCMVAAMQSPEPPRDSPRGNSNFLSRRGFSMGAGATAATVAAGAAAPAAASGTSVVAQPASAGTSQSQRCVDVARALLLRGPDGQELLPSYLRVLVGSGLPRSAGRSKKVLVVGAGPAGLVTALLLRRAGHTVTVVEANGNRVGGRIKTFRTGGHEQAEQDRPEETACTSSLASITRMPPTHHDAPSPPNARQGRSFYRP
ncbi:FAD-dependent oxidoreductase [Streptomyces sp. NPDC006692]|uniref:FAD-dependent oxidoreductase n=1 Tax=Streptomyces sp. NPDC006692 TaxID=3364758 RepID=UPI00369462FA